MTTEKTPAYIIGHLDWPTRFRFVLALALGLAIMGSIGFSVLRPWDPLGPISLLLADHEFLLVVRATAVLTAAAMLSTVIMDGRLAQFGTFIAAVALCYPVAETAGMPSLMVKLQAGQDYGNPGLWIGLAGETLVWTAMFAVVLLCDALVERWVGRAARQATKENRRIRRLLEVLRGLLSFAITAILSFLLVSVLAASSAKGQVLFAAAAGFFVAALAASWVTGERRPVWQVLAVPVTALAAYLYAAARPDRPRGMEEFLQLAPHAVVRLLPVEYFAAGIAGAVFGTWTAVRIAHESEADGADGAKAGG